MTFKKRVTYYLFGLFIGLFIVYFITSQKKTEFNYFPSKRVIADIKKKSWLYDSTFTDQIKKNILEDVDINFSKSILNVDSCNIYHLIKRNKYRFTVKNCTNKVFFSNLISTE